LVFDNGDRDLKQYAEENKDKMNDPHTLKFIAYQIFKGMDYCHKNKILHRDMKPQNILVNNVISLINPVKLIF
jgi:serine/threonine protein kinase